MARDVLTLRLSDQEREKIAAAAAKERLTLSEFLRRAALLIAHRLELPRVEPETENVRSPNPPEIPANKAASTPPGRHVFNTYHSLEQYRTQSPFAWSGPTLPPGGSLRDVG